MSFRLLFVILVCFAPPAFAWGPEGHRIVAELAARQLTPSARAAVKQLLRGEPDPSLPGVANWADELRNDPKQQALWQTTRGLHYVNFPRTSCTYNAARDCKGGNCVIAAIERNARILGDRRASPAARREALKFVVHFVGDVHQPLHAGYADDKGGNAFQINYRGQGTNLHSLWDSKILGSRKLGWNAYASALAHQPALTPERPRGAAPARWAEESCRLIKEKAIYPKKHKIGDAYIKTMRPVEERRLRQAGARLAALLNSHLGK